MYTDKNYKSKKALKDDIKAGKEVTYHQPGGCMFPSSPVPRDGVIYLEGPHYPEPHRWYAEATVKDGKIVKVK